jgi:hypothetical protein
MSRPFTKLSDSFKILRDNLNTTSYNVGDPDNLLTYGDSDVVMAINEIERVFDASAGEILYPTGNALQGETATRLLISTAQASGTDIQMNVGANFNVNAVGDINLDAGGANINFLDDSVARFNFTLGTTNVLDVTGILDLNISSNLDADISGNSVLTTGGSQTQEGTTLNLDFSGDITLDADGNDILFKNGAGGDTVTHTLADNGLYTVQAPSGYVVNAVGDIVLDADGGDIVLRDDGVQFGKMTNSLKRLHIYSGSTQALHFDSSANATFTQDLTVNGNTDLDGTLNVDGATTLNGHVDLGNATSDNISIIGRVDTNIVPDADDTYDFGTSALQWRHAFFDGTVTTDSLVTDSADIANFNVVSNTISNPNAVTLDGGNAIHLDTHTGSLTMKKAGTTRLAYTLAANNVLNATGSLTTNATTLIKDSATTSHTTVAGTSIVHTAGTTLTNTSGGAMQQTSGGNWTATVTGNALIDASGDITLDADGNDIFFKNGAGGDTVTHTLADNAKYTIAAPDDYTIDAVGDIVLDAGGDNITLKDAGTTRIGYTLGATNTIATTGNLTNNTSGAVVDSAASYTGTFTGAYATTAGGNQTATVGGNYVLDANGDITLDANGNDIILRDGASDRIKHTLGATNTTAVTGNYTVDASGDIVLDAGGNDLDIKGAGTTRFAYGLGASNTIDVTGNLTQAVGGNLTQTITGAYSDSATGAYHIGATGAVDIVSTSTLVTSSKAQTHTSNGAYNVNVTGAAKIAASTTITLDAAGDIILDAAGDDVILKDAGTEYGRFKHAGANQLGIYSNGILTATLNDSDIVFNNDVNIENDLDVDRDLNVDRNTTLNGNVDLGNATGDTISFLGRVDTNIVPSTDGTRDLGSSSLEMRHGFFDGTVTTDGLVADSADIGNFNIIANAISNSNAVTLTTGALTATVTGNALIDASGDITLDADGNDIIFKNGAGGDTVTHTLADDATYKVIAPSTYTLDVNGDIVLDANGGDVYLKDNGTQFGRFQNSSNQLDIYSGATLAVAMDASKVEIHGRAFFVDSGVNTVAQNIAGSINEIHTQLDSAVGEILVNKGNIATNDTELTDHLSRLDSDATFLQSNLGRIDTNSANIATNVSNITAVNTLVGTLNTLDSSAPGGFFKGINNDSIVKALNELATRTVLIYDESGTLLN